MNTLSTYGSTVFKFDRSGKKWKELGSGVISFTLKDDRLLISVNALTFFVQGGVRQKGPKAVVMRVRDDSLSKGKSENIILAVRFERERDARNLFTLLASTQWIRPRHRGRKPRRREPPAFFMSMGTREKENIRALVANAEQQYIEDHTIQRQLAVIYKMTPLQIEEAINFFQPWLRHSSATVKRSTHPRAPSLSVTRTESSLPSIRTSKLPKGRKPPSHPTPAGSTRPGGSLRAHAPSHISPQLELGAVGLGQGEVEGKQNKPEIAVAERLHLESNEAKERPKKLALKNSSPVQQEIPIDNNLAPPTGNVKGKSNGMKRKDSGEADERTSSMRRYEYSTPRTSSPGRSVSASRGVCQLTMQNLMLHNKMVPQLKRDTHEKVTLWLKEFQRE